MINIPEYLTLLSTIKQLFQNKETENSDKTLLYSWAQKTAQLQLQVTSQSVSLTLLTSLIHDSTQIMAINIKRYNQLGTSNEADKQGLNQFHLLIEQFYQALNQLTPAYTDEEIANRWRSVSQPTAATDVQAPNSHRSEVNRNSPTSGSNEHQAPETNNTSDNTNNPTNNNTINNDTTSASIEAPKPPLARGATALETENNSNPVAIDCDSQASLTDHSIKNNTCNKTKNHPEDSLFLTQLFDDKEE